jgi:cyclopropane-fatty-acyl-phospholipid synthase
MMQTITPPPHRALWASMPSDDLPLWFQDRLRLIDRWRWDGRHYERTLNAWLERMDAAREQVWPLLEQTYGKDQAGLWWMRWRDSGA